MKKNISAILGILGMISLLLSFVIHSYYLQFLVLGIFFLCLFIATYRKKEIEELKKIIEEHNKLIKEDIDELKKR